MPDRPRIMIVEGTIPEGADPDDYEDGSWMLLPDDEQEEVRAWLEAERERRRRDPVAAQEYRERMQARSRRARERREARGRSPIQDEPEADFPGVAFAARWGKDDNGGS